MDLQAYLETAFPALVLKPSIYNQWKHGIHFELGQGMYQFNENDELNLKMFDTVYSQTSAIFHDIFDDEDEMFLVANVHLRKGSTKRSRPFRVYKKGVKNKDVLYRLKQVTLPYVFAEEEEADNFYTAQYQLKSRKQDLNYSWLLKAACNEDFPLKPKFRKEKGVYYPDVFFINASKNIIFFIYDDRGCEVVAADKEILRPLYEKYNGWLDEWSREEIDQSFARSEN